LLGDFGLESLAKVSGSKGIQVYVPLNSSIIYGLTQSFAKAVAELLEQRNPRLIVSRMPKVFRAKKVFIDWSQNAIFKTTVGVYSLRAKSHKPYVSVPVGWDELRLAFEQSSADNLYFEPARTLKRVEQLGDLFAPLLSKVQTLPGEVLKYFKKTTTKTTDKLEAYVDKRNSRTSERKPDRLSRSSQGGRRRFVIQKHAANQIHYDFRLEMHGVLKSWAVPKGPPPFKQEEKRLAIIAEDRPIEYLDFEGVIPRRQYGSGTVMVWDIGSYELIEGNYYKGFLRIHLEGSKLKGEWCLQRSAGEKREKWEIEKTNGSMRAISRIRDDQSALSSRSMGEIRDAGDSPWGSN
jgi:bifunctional non-homologous end joining protein LigD